MKNRKKRWREEGKGGGRREEEGEEAGGIGGGRGRGRARGGRGGCLILVFIVKILCCSVTLFCQSFTYFTNNGLSVEYLFWNNLIFFFRLPPMGIQPVDRFCLSATGTRTSQCLSVHIQLCG